MVLGMGSKGYSIFYIMNYYNLTKIKPREFSKISMGIGDRLYFNYYIITIGGIL